jgi:hypothetical protein
MITYDLASLVSKKLPLFHHERERRRFKFAGVAALILIMLLGVGFWDDHFVRVNVIIPSADAMLIVFPLTVPLKVSGKVSVTPLHVTVKLP